jgi:hypothetical protein
MPQLGPLAYAEIRMQAFVFTKFLIIDMFHIFHTKKEYNAFHLW